MSAIANFQLISDYFTDIFNTIISPRILNTPEHSPVPSLITSFDCMCDLLVFQVHFISGSHILHSESEEMKCDCDYAVIAVIGVFDVF
jgi:hypothetical protein